MLTAVARLKACPTIYLTPLMSDPSKTGMFSIRQ